MTRSPRDAVACAGPTVFTRAAQSHSSGRPYGRGSTVKIPRRRRCARRYGIAAAGPTAFALPGGFIFIARPLVDLCGRDRDEMAFILGHEMAHVIRRHAIDRLLKQKVLSAVTMVSPGRGALASWIRQVGFRSLELAYSRDEEFEADELSLLLMRAAGFDPAGAIRMLQRLGDLDRRPDPLGLGAYLSTHPPMEGRVSRLRRVAAKRS